MRIVLNRFIGPLSWLMAEGYQKEVAGSSSIVGRDLYILVIIWNGRGDRRTSDHELAAVLARGLVLMLRSSSAV